MSAKSKFETISGGHGYVSLTYKGEQLFIKKAVRKFGIGFWKLKKNRGDWFTDVFYFHDKKLTSYPVRVTACKSKHYEGNKLIWDRKRYFYTAEMVPSYMGY